ncbi:hypothetical protein FPZ12_034265 [Amycolatopsis acidicola]|uniref:DUF6801 domain-containing protein n=1 Tax=Amycolatopsis acidicola TaxID=2596893 RepID=A0A5N0UQZ1_9PSEU|nr:DUF6801 domain-containing protein [Amycolatopsis acidicola]KAA9153515.1 hypothetical protein FPZ12_034265 [Amycolatopsis acidicola]
MRFVSAPRAVVAVAGLAAVAAALLPAVPAAAGPASRAGTSACGSTSVPASFSATFPDSVAAGTQVVASGPAVTLVIPADAVTALRTAGGTTVDASAAVSLTVSRNGAGTALQVSGLSTTDIALPESGDLRITLTGAVPAFAVSAQATVALASLTPKIVVHQGETTQDLGCAADPAAAGDLATIAVTSTATAAPAIPAIQAAAEDAAPLLTAHFRVDTTSRIAKLGSDLVAGNGTFDAGLYTGQVANTVDILGDLSLPRASGYFIAFRFMPVTSDIELPQAERAAGSADITNGVFTPTIDVTAKVDLVLTNVKEDGVPLEVGSHCRTGSPLVFRLRGRSDLTPGARSTIQTTFDIPPFTGCGVKEDLDPLLTGLISGPGNTLTTVLTSTGIG